TLYIEMIVSMFLKEVLGLPYISIAPPNPCHVPMRIYLNGEAFLIKLSLPHSILQRIAIYVYVSVIYLISLVHTRRHEPAIDSLLPYKPVIATSAVQSAFHQSNHWLYNVDPVVPLFYSNNCFNYINQSNTAKHLKARRMQNTFNYIRIRHYILLRH